MSRPAPEIRLSTEEKEILLRWMRGSKTEQRMVERARVILLASNGLSGKEIALKMQTRAARVSKWLRRFARDRIAALNDHPRSGTKRRKYTSATEERILKALDEPPPAGYSRWNGRLLAQHLGEVSQHQVWRVMRKHDLHLERRQSWCVSTDPEFSRKAADVVGLLFESARECLGALRRRKTLHSSSGAGPRLDPLTQRPGTDRLCSRVQTPWNHDALCRPQRG